MPYKSVLKQDGFTNALATMRDLLHDDRRRSTDNICEMLELAESGIAYNLKESVQREIAFASRSNEIIGAKIDTLNLVSRLLAQFTKYEYVKEEVTDEAIGG